MEHLDKVNQVDEQTRTKIHKLCSQYLGMEWQNVDVNHLIINKIRQGLANVLYICELPSNSSKVQAKTSSRSRVVIKFLAERLKTSESAIHATICYLIAGEKSIGPKILGVFPEGFISEHYGTRNYSNQDDFNDSSIKLLATKLAQFHTLQLPFPKDKTKCWHEATFDNFINHDFLNNLMNVKLKEVIKEAKLSNLLMHDLVKEVKLIENAIYGLKSPLVLTHQDFNRANILVEESFQKDQSIHPLIDIKFIDFDGCSFMYRGLDLGKYFSEWRVEHKTMIAISYPFPSDQEMDVFLSAYRTECGKQFGLEWIKNELNSIETLRHESKVFALYSYFQSVVFSLWFASEENDLGKRKKYLKNGDASLSCYFKLKDMLVQGGVNFN